MIWTTIISFTIILGYLIWSIWKLEYIPDSISNTYYLTGKKAWFTLAIITGALSLIPGALEITPENIQAIPFIAAVGMLMVGAAPNFKDYEKTIHYLGAIILLAFSQIWVMIMKPELLIPWIIYGVGLVWKKRICNKEPKNWVFWAEIVIIINVYATVILSEKLYN